VKSAVETLSPTRAKLTVEVPFEELKPSLDAAYKAIAQQINIPGFRRGKVPPMVIDKQVGRGAVLDQAINDVLPKKYVEALQANELEPLAQPEVEVTRLEDNDVLEFTAEVDVKPTIELPTYDGLEASVEDIEISDEDVEEQVTALRQRFGTLTDVERPAADGDFVVLDLKAMQDGEVLEGAEITGTSYQVGRGGMIDGLDEALVGMSAGEEKVSIPLPETLVTEELNARRQNIEQQLAMAGITMAKYLEDEGQTQEEFEADLDRRVRDAVAAQFLLDEIAKKEELGVDQQELSQHLVRRAQQSGQDPQSFANHMFEHNHIPDLVQEILRGKALATIVESATVKDASGNVVELKGLQPDGTIADVSDEEPAAEAEEEKAEA